MSFAFSLRRAVFAATVVALSAAFAAAPLTDAAARLGGGGSFGSRGSRTYSMPSVTPTAPRPSAIPGSGYGGYGQGGFAPRPSGGFLSGGFGRGLLGGLVGAGLFGMLFGNGFGGGLGGPASLFGLLLQLGLLYLLFRFVMGFFRNRQTAYGGGGYGGASPYQGAGPSGFAGASRGEPIAIQADDYTAFERRLVEAQTLYSAENMGALRQITTPQMADHFAGELAENARQGVVNRLSDIRLLQGDLAEAWREGGTDFATVAMRFSLVDTMVQRASGQLVSGYANGPQQVTELWTFARPAGAGADRWLLSAIQQAS